MSLPTSTDQGEISLAYLPPTPRQTRSALVLAAALLLGYVVLAQFAGKPLPEANGFIPALDAIIFVTDLLTAGLFFAHFSVTRSRSLLVLACGYLFSALIVVAHGLSFPGAFFPTGDWDRSFRIAFRLYIFWHLGPPATLFAYVWLRDKDRTKAAVQAPTALVAICSVAGVVALVGLLVWLAVAGDEVLPSPLSNFDPLSSSVPGWVVGLTMLLSAAALFVLWAFRRSVLDQWLMVVVLASMVELAIRFHPIAAGAHITVGFYIGRLLFSLITSTFVLTALIAETTRLYAGVARANMLASIVKASQVLSSEIILPKMIDQLMKITMENAGADRGLLILPSGKEYLIQAEARAFGSRIEVTPRQEPITSTACPKSLVYHVIHTQESFVIDDASRQEQFASDDYLRVRQSKSVLCLPLIKKRELTGILLLENTLTSHAFTPARIAVLELLAAQAAISLENTRLYSWLNERETKIRRLVEANIIGIHIWRLDGEVLEANEAFLRMVDYSRDDLISGRVRWTDLTPPEWRDRDEQAIVELKTRGAFKPFEKEYSRRDGRRVPVLIGGALFKTNGSEGVAFILDLSEQKRAESAMSRAQTELAHVSRITTLGEMTASIAHEVNQPLGSVVNNANACLSILSNGSPHIGEVRQALEEIISGANRASAVISRIRKLSKKVPFENALVDLTHVVTEVMSLVRPEAATRQVNIQINMAGDLPSVLGDHVQLQQVLLNLVVNGMEAMTTIEPSKRAIVISGQREFRGEKPWCLIRVQDAGIGVKPENATRLFEAFYTTKSEGMGMGLAISRSIIEAHGGQLWVEPGERPGATFLFRLPAEVCH